MQDTPEQTAIFKAGLETNTSLMINAYAGTGKTTTITKLANLLDAQGKGGGVALAFNTKIKQELERRFPKTFTVMTLNGLGHRAWGRAIGKSLRLEERKLGLLVTEALKPYQLPKETWDDVRRLVTGAMQKGLVPSVYPHKGLLTDTVANWSNIADDLWISACETTIQLARAVLINSIKQAFDGVISFDDQIYCSTMLGGVFPRFALVLGDEAQDWSPLNHIQLAKTASDRIIAVGDPKQCFLPGTKISITVKDMSYFERYGAKAAPSLVDIEDIKVGTQLVSFNSRKTYFPGTRSQGRKVLAVSKQDYSGPVITIQAGEYSHTCTPNHRCLVRFNTHDAYVVYLMQKGDQFRIGTSKLKYTNSFGPAARARQEGADALWILTPIINKEQVLVEEKAIAAIFGLPLLVFKDTGGACTPQHLLDAAWARIGSNGERALRCLHYYGRMYEYPIWQKNASESHIGFYSFVTQACNLIDGFMSVKTFNGNERDNNWCPISVNVSHYDGPVFGLTVEPCEDGRRLYVANGIVTHNSLYAFRGADSSSMTNLRKLRKEWIDLPLATTFRCPKVIVARQQTHAPGFLAYQANPMGAVYNGSHYTVREGELEFGTRAKDSVEITWTWPDVQALGFEKVAILSRNNAQLISMAFKLLRQQIGVRMLGRDIGKGLIALSKKIMPNDATPAGECANAIEKWKNHECDLAYANSHEEKVAGITDRAESLMAVLESAMVETAGQLRKQLEYLFSKDTGQVLLSTIHKSKGMEWPLVIHLDPWRIPSKHARKAAAAGNSTPLDQDRNAVYVCETRAQKVLILANLQDFQ